jgi:hypothetical protein
MTLTEYVKGTYAMIGQEISDLQLAMTVEKLSGYPEEAVRKALSRAQDECKRLTYTDILDRLPGGHPGPEEAWATIAKAMNNEALSLIWTDEMREAYGVANGVSDDPVQARMAFKETYSKAVAEARATRKPLNWTLSKGTDKALLELVLTEGVKAGKLTAAYANRQLPYLDLSEGEALRVMQSVSPRLLSGMKGIGG